MKVRSLAVLFCAVMLTLSIGCGGSGGGGGGAAAPTPLATGTFIKTIDPTPTNSGGHFNAASSYARWQTLYTSNTISASGKITGMALQTLWPTSGVTCTHVTIKMGHTGQTLLNNNYANNYSNGKGVQTTVLSDATVTFPAGNTGDWYAITFTTPFDYNGVDNLVIDYERTASCSASFDDAIDTHAVGIVVRSFTAGAAGSLDNWLPLVKLQFAGGEKAVEFPGGGPSGVPFAGNRRVQNMYLASEMTGTGPITGLALQSSGTTTVGVYAITLKLGHTTKSALTTTFASNYDVDAPVTVVSNATYTIPAGIPDGTYFWLPFPGSFTYNGKDNLIVDLDVSSASATNTMHLTTTTVANRIALGDSGSSTANINMTDTSLHAKFRFNGGTMDVISNAVPSVKSVFNSTSGVRQFLLRATELGTAGSINKLACRSGNASIADDYPLVVTLATTTRTELDTVNGTNIADGSIVYSGTFPMPGDLLQGDWIEIPFSTPFSYNGIDNLVVQTSITGAVANIQYCQVTSDASFVNRFKFGGTAPSNDRGVFKFWVNK